jgi:hypothetical protein
MAPSTTGLCCPFFIESGGGYHLGIDGGQHARALPPRDAHLSLKVGVLIGLHSMDMAGWLIDHPHG